MSAHLTPKEVHAKIDHPIVDGDGHWVEYDPVFAEKMRRCGGDLAADGFFAGDGDDPRNAVDDGRGAPREADRPTCVPDPPGGEHARPRDRDDTVPLVRRLGELGLDFVVVYPTAGLRLPRIPDDATRRAVILTYNLVSADYFGGLGDRMTPAAIPRHTDEAIEELEFVTRQLGSKVGMFGSNMAHKEPAAAANDPDTARFNVWYDVLGLDSEYD